jgi:hypothetical protein
MHEFIHTATECRIRLVTDACAKLSAMRVSALHTYPIKGCYRLDLDDARVEPWGLAGDRRWMVVDADGEAVTQREAPALTGVRPAPRSGGGLIIRSADAPDLDVPEPAGGPLVDVSVFGQPLAATFAGDGARAWFSKLLDRDARLVWLDDPTRRPVHRDRESPERVTFADEYPVALTNTASLAALNDWLAEAGSPEWPLPMTRFRPNIVIDGAEPWVEDGWTGGRVRIGAVPFRVAGPIGRCVVTTTDQETGVRGHEPLRILGRYRNVNQKLLFAANLVPDARGRIAVGDPVERA